VLSLSRQNLPNLENSTIEHASKGGYVIHEEEGEDLTIVSAGSEVSIAVEAAGKLKAEGIKTRVVSLPCWSVFDKQSAEYKLSILRSGAPILSLEALSVGALFSNGLRMLIGVLQTTGWQKYSHEQYGLPAWGASGPYQKVYEKFGITGSSMFSLGCTVATSLDKFFSQISLSSARRLSISTRGQAVRSSLQWLRPSEYRIMGNNKARK
jgi:transketolase